jgi:hypothetical protein
VSVFNSNKSNAIVLSALLMMAAVYVYPALADTAPGGVRFLGNTWNQALIAVPPNLTHAEFINEGGAMSGVRVHMLETDKVVLDIDKKQYELDAEPGAFCAEWLNQFIADMNHRIDLQHPYLTETITISVGKNGQPFNFDQDATIAKAGPFQQLPANMKSITMRVHTSPGQLTSSEALSVELLK